MRILVVEDEPNLRSQLADMLEAESYAVDTSEDGVDAEFQGNEIDYDAAVVDLGLPGKSGLEVIRSWRGNGRRFPVLILTARGHWQDKVEGLEAGADDYLVKPFQPEELLARMRALIRRASGLASRRLRAGPVEMDLSARELRLNGERVELTNYEFRTLEYLMLHAGEAVSRTALSEHIYAEDQERDSNTLEVFVGRLRKKLDPGNALGLIETQRGFGYRFTLPVESV
ncbi:response regulator transcription factor [Hahella sp. SMD15-11]|uniref:Response regulator transcription factor n=1 Tax=Thermohahella caldifontis TaxID=3142973 RepID=A0AB39UV43_9GAMM